MKFLLLFIYMFSSSAIASSHIPKTPNTGIDKDLNLRVFYKKFKFNWLAQYSYSNRENEDNHKSFAIGGKYRIHKNLKLGSNLHYQFGNRHDDDWIKKNGWKWDQTNKRSETLLSLDVIPRILLDFFPGERWVGEFRLRYIYNFFNSQSTIKLRPRITYFWFNEKGPFINLFMQYETYLPVNYGDKNIYEKWVYLGAIYHFNKLFFPGIYIAKKSLTWTSSSDAKKFKPLEPYEINHKSIVYGLNFTIKIP